MLRSEISNKIVHDLNTLQQNYPETDFKSEGARILESCRSKLPITLMDLRSEVTIADIRKIIPDKRVFACDFYVEQAEKAAFVLAGFDFRDDLVLNIDHHAPIELMYSQISSANLAIKYVQNFGIASNADVVLIHHTDYDSISSAGIMSGTLPPIKLFGDAAIAADHTGDENLLADLLQVLDSRRNIANSFIHLGKLLMGERLTESAYKLLLNRWQQRSGTESEIKKGDVIIQNGELPFIKLQANMFNTFLPQYLPEAWVIMTFEPGKNAGNHVIRWRLGNAAPEGFTLKNINTEDSDPGLKGRWNAGANARAGGTEMNLDEYYLRMQMAFENAKNTFLKDAN